METYCPEARKSPTRGICEENGDLKGGAKSERAKKDRNVVVVEE